MMSSILQLPNSSLELIFKNTKNLKGLSFTCSRFHAVVSNSKILMDKIVLNLEELEFGNGIEFMRSLIAVLGSEKQFQHICITDKFYHQYIPIFKIHSKSIRSVIFTDFLNDNYLDSRDLSKILKLVGDSLECIILNGIYVHHIGEAEIVDLPKLKKLVIVGHNYAVLKYFKKSKITHLEIRSENEDNDETRKNIQFLVDFLSVQNDLEVYSGRSVLPKYVLGEQTEKILDNAGVLNEIPLTGDDVAANFHFNLKELKWRLSCNGDKDKVHQFLKMQTRLESLQSDIQDFMLETVLHELPKLKKLSVNLLLSRISDFNKFPGKNSTITELEILDSSAHDSEVVEFLLQLLPNVKIFKLKDINVWASLADKLTESFQHLKCIKLLECTWNNPTKIGNVKEVEMKNCSKRNMMEFILANTQIEKLKLSCQIDDMLENEDLKDILKMCHNMRHLDVAEALSISSDHSHLAEIVNMYDVKLEYLKVKNRKSIISNCKEINSSMLKICF